MINGVWINLVLLLFRIQRELIEGAGPLPLVKLPALCCWSVIERECREGESSVHIFHVHPHPSCGSGAESSFVRLWVVWRLLWYGTHLSSLTVRSLTRLRVRSLLGSSFVLFWRGFQKEGRITNSDGAFVITEKNSINLSFLALTFYKMNTRKWKHVDWLLHPSVHPSIPPFRPFYL